MEPNTYPQDEMSAENAKAALGHSTRLVEEFLVSQNPQLRGGMPVEDATMPLGGEMMPGGEEAAPVDNEALKNEIMGELQEGIKDIVREEMSSLRQEIKDALDEDEEE